jgi:ATP-dependent helicase HrpB
LTPNSLPIDPLLPEIVAALRAGRSLVVEAPPGAGKTTRVPRALLEASPPDGGEIWVLEPRRLPTRLAAERVARERGERPGETVGYTVRFEDVTSARTRLRFVTEGVLARRLVGDPRLAGVAAVVLDEFHERHVATDVALALLRRLQTTTRPDLRLVAMSATLEAAPLRKFLGDGGDAASVRSEGRLHPIDVEHLPKDDDRPLHEQVVGAVRRLLREGLEGDVLVFLPGAGEIRRAQEALAAAPGASLLTIRPLHGDLSLEEQTQAIRPEPGKRKIILSTNVAESSVTVEGVVAVVDSGLARVAAHSPWTGLPTLAIQKISRASATQRAGRAGRVRPGRALRLYTRLDHDLRPAHEVPELGRADLAETLLTLAALDVGKLDDFPWFEAPPDAAVGAARELLVKLGALDAADRLTPLGRRMARLPVHPRLARLVCEGETRGAAAGAALVAALVSERDIRRGARASFGPRGGDDERGEILDLVDLYREAEKQRFRGDSLRALELDGRAVEAVSRAQKQLASAVSRGEPVTGTAEDAALRLATLAAFPDRVGRRRGATDRTVVFAGGGSAELRFDPGADWLVAVDVEHRMAGATGPRAAVAVRLAAAIEPEWLLEVCAADVRDVDGLAWNPELERVERRSGLRFGALSLDESVSPAPPGPETTRLLADAALARGVERLPGAEELPRLLARLAFAREIAPKEADEAGLPAFAGDDVSALVRLACEGRHSFRELAEADLATSVLQSFPYEAQRLLEALAPERVSLPGGRSVKVSYVPGQPPFIESRLQDFFGMRAGPTVGGGRVALTLHLLAPNGRAVQVTRDLANFWVQHYPPLRRELGRRYPKHAWPEDGATAKPPPPKPPRPR